MEEDDKISELKKMAAFADQLMLFSKMNKEEGEKLTKETEALLKSGKADAQEIKRLKKMAKRAMNDARVFERDAIYFLKIAKGEK